MVKVKVFQQVDTKDFSIDDTITIGPRSIEGIKHVIDLKENDEILLNHVWYLVESIQIFA